MVRKSRLNPANEEIKQDYRFYLKYQRDFKLNNDSIKDKMSKIDKYDEFFNYADFIEFDANKGVEYYKHLLERFEDGQLEMSTVLSYLNTIKEFLNWYFDNHKVKSKKTLIASLVTLEPKDEHRRLAQRLEYVEYPTHEEFEQIISFPEETILDKRDKAILTFLYLSGARVSAVATATIKSFDEKRMIFFQDPLEGIKTKRSKHIISKLIKFDNKYYEIVRNWINFLKTEYGFKDCDPLFPVVKDVVKKNFMNGEADYRKMIAKRCKDVLLPEYHPHAFRHAHIYKGLSYVRNGLQLRALSQNVGHESMMTILEKYAKMKPEEYMRVLDDMVGDGDVNNELSKFSTLDLCREVYSRVKCMCRMNF